MCYEVSVNELDSDLRPPLHYAACRDKPEYVRWLLEKGVVAQPLLFLTTVGGSFLSKETQVCMPTQRVIFDRVFFLRCALGPARC